MATELLDRILADIKNAMKARDQETVTALRLLHSEIKNVAINERRDLTNDDVLTVVGRLVKQRQEAIDQFAQGGRDDLVAKETHQLNLYRAYQPEQLSEDELAALVDQAIAATGASSKRDIGAVMKMVMPQVKGRADGKTINAVVNHKLSV